MHDLFLRVPSCSFVPSCLFFLLGCGLMGSAASAQATSPRTTQDDNAAKLLDVLIESGAVKPGTAQIRSDTRTISPGTGTVMIDLGGGRAAVFQQDSSSGSAAGIPPRGKLIDRVPLEKAAYLGIASTPVPSALREQLNLKVGAGILVERVEPDSPALVAGIKQYDVIEKLDDQILINAQQLAILVRMHAAGDELKLSIIRQGQKQVVSVKLVEKELPVIGEANLWGLPSGGWPADEGNVTLFGGKVGGTSTTIRGIQTAAPRQMRVNILSAPYRLEYTESPNAEQEQQTHLKVTDARNEVIFDGPVDTEEQRSLLPDQVKRSIGQLKPLRSSSQPTGKPAPASR